MDEGRRRVDISVVRRTREGRRGKYRRVTTMDKIKWIGDRMVPGIRMTRDLSEYHSSGKCPMLDFQVWAHHNQAYVLPEGHNISSGISCLWDIWVEAKNNNYGRRTRKEIGEYGPIPHRTGEI